MTVSREEYERRGRRSRRRGKDGQRDLFRYLCELFELDSSRGSGTYTQDHPDLRFRIGPAAGHHLEGKNCATWEPRAWIRQAEEDAGDDPWVIGFARPGYDRRRVESRAFRFPWYILSPKLELENALGRARGVSGLSIATPGGSAFQDVTSTPALYEGIGTFSFRTSRGAGWKLKEWVLEAERMCGPGGVVEDWTLFLERPKETIEVEVGGGYVEIVDGEPKPLTREELVYRAAWYAVLPALAWAHILIDAEGPPDEGP